MGNDSTPDKQVEAGRNPDGTFKAGYSGNPSGRPRLGESMTELMREYLDGAEEGARLTRKQQLIRKIAQLAYIQGDLNAMKLIWNYLDGMPVQKTLTKEIEDDLSDVPTEELLKTHKRLTEEVADSRERDRETESK